VKSDTIEAKSPTNLRFSGHETFACRYAWLPKAYRSLKTNPGRFSDEDGAMVELGLGKNMVRSTRFWVEHTGLAVPDGQRNLLLTEFAHAIFETDGLDPYLEDIRTLWLIHWNLAARDVNALFAWRYLLNHWPYPEFTRSEAFAAFTRESMRLGYSHSAITLTQHLEAFLHTYYPPRSRNNAIEDSLDGPLVELGLLQAVGEKKSHTGRWETVYAFAREPKPEITEELFEFCLMDFWTRFRANEETLTLREVAFGLCSPGQVFKLPEDDVRARLEAYAQPRAGAPFTYQPSAVHALLFRRRRAAAPTLKAIYRRDHTHV
jgi:hypothetical protein